MKFFILALLSVSYAFAYQPLHIGEDTATPDQIHGVAAEFATQVYEMQDAGLPVVIGIYTARPDPDNTEFDENGPKDPLVRWRLDESSRVGNGYFPAKLKLEIFKSFGECPEFVNIPMLSSMHGMFSPAETKLSFWGRKGATFIITFSPSGKNKNYIAFPVKNFKSVIGITEAEPPDAASDRLHYVMTEDQVVIFLDELRNLLKGAGQFTSKFE